MTLRLLLFSGVALGAIGSCADSLDGTIDYSLTGGIGGVQMTVHIDPDGEMMRRKLDGSMETTQLEPTIVSDLTRKIDQAGFPTLEPAYMCCPDDFVHTISVHVDGAEYKVIAGDSASYPDRLRPLIDTLSMMSRAELDGN